MSYTWVLLIITLYVWHISVPSGCDVIQNVTDEKQYITTENYPRSYLEDQYCRYNFVAPPGRKFIVDFEHVDIGKGQDYIIFRKYTAVYRLAKITETLYPF